MSEPENIRTLLREMESIVDVDQFREKAAEVIATVDAASARSTNVEKALAMCVSAFLPGDPPRVLSETDAVQQLVDEGLLLAEQVAGGEVLYDLTVPGINLVRQALTEVYTANRVEVVR
jgi:hypothetical protein